jgi:hypothetical protein
LAASRKQGEFSIVFGGKPSLKVREQSNDGEQGKRREDNDPYLDLQQTWLHWGSWRSAERS